MIDGVLAVLKPVDYTSHDVVASLRRILKMKRIGHTGTLDPQVTGVLPICLGKATRLVEYIQDLPKSYECVLRIGMSSDTEDASGEVIERVDHVDCSKEDITKVLQSFVGEVEQVPPMYSAVKVNGKRLYEIARQGEVVERQPRRVQIHRIDLLHIDLNKRHPEVRFQVQCSKGTYIRTLCVDIGKALGYPALMAELIRTSSGHFELEHCLTLEDIAEHAEQQRLDDIVIPMDEAVNHLPKLHIKQEFALRAKQGQKLSLHVLHSSDEVCKDEYVNYRLYDTNNDFIGIFTVDVTNERIQPVKVFI